MNVCFWAEDTVLAAQEIVRHFPHYKQKILAQADNICAREFIFQGHWEMERTQTPTVFESQIIWDKTTNDDPEWVFAFNRLTFLVELGQAWQFSHDTKYLTAFEELADDWLSNAPLTEQAKNTTWRAIETGIRCENLLRGCALLGDALKESLQVRIEESLRVHAQWLLQADTPFQRLSNWGVLQNHGLFLAGLALENEMWCKTAVDRLCLELDTQVFHDGTQWEQSPMYHGEVLHCCLDTMVAAKHAGYVLPACFTQKVNKMSQAMALWLRPDGRLFCQSDSDEIDARDLVSLAALLFNDEKLALYSDKKVFPQTIWDWGIQALNQLDLMQSQEKRTSAALPDSGNYFLWGGTTNDAAMLHFHCGTLGSGHGHADQLHIDLVCQGETILADSGRYTYVDNDLRRKLKSPAGHNTIRVDGQDFTVYKNSWDYSPIAEPVKGIYRFTENIDYVSGGHLGYLSLGVFVRRRVLRLGQDVFVILDCLSSQSPDSNHSYERRFHFGTGSVSLQKNGAYCFTGKRAHAQLFLPEEGQHSLSKEPMSRQYNLLEEADCVTQICTRKGSLTLGAVLVTGVKETVVCTLPVTLQRSGKEIPSEQAYALHIVYGKEEWTIISLQDEVISEVDLIQANGFAGYGKVLVFEKNYPNGICMEY